MTERRARIERRRDEDCGPPKGRFERRRRAERRLPVAELASLSAVEFEHWFGRCWAQNANAFAEQHAADVFERVRDN